MFQGIYSSTLEIWLPKMAHSTSFEVKESSNFSNGHALVATGHDDAPKLRRNIKGHNNCA